MKTYFVESLRAAHAHARGVVLITAHNITQIRWDGRRPFFAPDTPSRRPRNAWLDQAPIANPVLPANLDLFK